MNLSQAIDAIIKSGKEAAARDYTSVEYEQHLAGSTKGFEECHGKSATELSLLLKEAQSTTFNKRRENVKDFWYWRCREAEIEWVCKVFSAILQNEGLPVIVPVTAMAVYQADRILKEGV